MKNYRSTGDRVSRKTVGSQVTMDDYYILYGLPHELEVSVPKIQYTITPRCTSVPCLMQSGLSEGYANSYSSSGIEKNVSKSVDICPDCGEYLFWEKKETTESANKRLKFERERYKKYVERTNRQRKEDSDPDSLQ